MVGLRSWRILADGFPISNEYPSTNVSTDRRDSIEEFVAEQKIDRNLTTMMP